MSFQGSLKELPVPDIVQLMSVSGKTGVFTLTRGPERGVIYLKNGQMVHSRLGEITGEEAVYALAIWSSGDFQFNPNDESDEHTITKSNTSLLMEAARRLDEWKVLSKKIPGIDAVPQLKERESPEPVTLSPQEWNLAGKIDGHRTIEEIARANKTSPFEVAKTLYGLVAADLVELRAKEPARLPPPAAVPIPPAAPGSPATLGDEKKILMILCTRVKQEAEAAMGEQNLPGIDRPYRQALAEIDRGRGIESVRDFIRQTEQTISALRGTAPMRTFQEKMALVMQPKA
ncbi:MAG TPA: DUF4388 domain-containing protein [Thermoanaerobaculia bacterium]|jgi:hypothetical protein|nr:DUF4388 domain-containing protein [Thermoanaerobaculia bacterium]